MDIQTFEAYLSRYTAVVQQAEDIDGVIAANLGALDKLSEDARVCLEAHAEMDSTIEIGAAAPTATTVLQLIQMLLQSSQHQIGLSMCLWARREHGVTLRQFVECRHEAMQRCVKEEHPDSPKRLFRDIYKAIRDGLLVSVCNAQIVYDLDEDDGDGDREAMLLVSGFCRHWVAVLLARGRQAIQGAKDVVELNALWTQGVILNKSMAKQGIAFMPLLEQDFIDKGFELCRVDAGKTRPAEADKGMIKDDACAAFADDPAAVGTANAIIDSVNALRHFAHPKLLPLLHKDLLETASRHAGLAQFVRQLLSTPAMTDAQPKPTSSILQDHH